MKTKKQEELITSYLSQFDDETKSLYYDIIMYLSELGYDPKKEKSNISFKHSLHNKQIVKMGTALSKKNAPSPRFSLRFSACRGYSQKIGDIVSSYIIKYPARVSRCTENTCNFCAGEADTHVYVSISPDGERKTNCGAYAIELPAIATDDLSEIKKLIREEHEYLLKNEAGIDSNPEQI